MVLLAKFLPGDHCSCSPSENNFFIQSIFTLKDTQFCPDIFQVLLLHLVVQIWSLLATERPTKHQTKSFAMVVHKPVGEFVNHLFTI